MRLISAKRRYFSAPRISPSAGGEIFIFGEPKSLESKTPVQGMRATLAHANCANGRRETSPAFLGRLHASEGSLVCRHSVEKFYLAFRTGGDPIYWLRLETTRAHESEDAAILDKIAETFRLIRWTLDIVKCPQRA